MDNSMSSSTPTTPTTITSAPPPLLAAPTRPREVDEVSIASDFSVIPESLVEPEGAGAAPSRTISTTSFLHSEDLQPSLRAMESHTKVTFQSVQATYFCDSDIAVTYTLGSDVQPKSSDRVGLYRVGFTSPQDYLGYQWAPTPSEDHTANGLPMTVVFKANNLPKEVGEFFQFCYVTHEGHIVGVSAPFQLLRVGASREMCVVEEDGMVVVRSSESVLHDKINELSILKDKLASENKDIRTVKEEMQRQLEEKTQQLNMCQHHLQALEVKMKRETSEKCELMGRIGQVVEEKGHLEDKLRTLDRTLASERTKAAANEAKVKEMEEAALTSRKTLEKTTHSLRALEEDLATTKDSLKVTSERLEEEKRVREKAVKDLEIWTSTIEADQSEKNSLALKFSTVNEELIAKLEELEAARRNGFTLEEKLKTTLKELEEVRSRVEELEVRLEGLEAEKKVFVEREEVLGQDNTHLQASNTALKERVAELEEKQKTDEKGREAAETIASDLSGRLQAARAEYHNLAMINRKLAKKLKKMRQKMSVETASAAAMTTSTCSTSSWLHAEAEVEDDGEETGGDEQSGADEAAGIISQSCVGSLPSQHSAGGTSCCSHNTQQLSDAVHRKMEDIVRELSQQILSLKLQLQEKEERKEGAPQPQHDQEREEEEEEEEARGEQVDAQQEEAGTEPGATAVPESPPVLYGNSFLPTAPTAPVFLPEGGNTAAARPPSTTAQPPATTATAQAPTTATDPTPAPRAHYYLPKGLPTPPTAPPTANLGFLLPPPLLPETTPTARHAAVLSQLTQQHLPTAPSAPGHESDDDDFHSTSDSDSPPATVSTPPPPPPPAHPTGGVEVSQPPLNQPQQPRSNGTSSPDDTHSLLPCPLCHLVFPRSTRRLLEDHVNSHLEHVCPVCSEVFQRNFQEKFQEHVQSHFKDEDERDRRRAQTEAERDAADPSGPWGRHLRNAHLLEID